MDMNRRRFVALAGGIVTLGGTGAFVVTSESEPTDTDAEQQLEEPPEGLEDVSTTATVFAQQIKRMYPDSYVGFSEQGEIVFKYAPDVSDGSALKRSVYEVTQIFVETCREETPAPLIVRAGGARAIVPITPLEQYINGELEKEAFQETIIFTEAPE